MKLGASHLRHQVCDLNAQLEEFRKTLRTEVPHLGCIRIAGAVGYVVANLYDERLSVSRIRNDMNLNNNNFSGIFRRYTGLGPRQFVERCRVRAACHVLQGPEPPSIVDLTFAVGYRHPESFHRAFKRTVGCTPAAFATSMHRPPPDPFSAHTGPRSNKSKQKKR